MSFLRTFVFSFYMYGLMILMGLITLPVLLGPRSWVRAMLRLYLTLLWGGMRVVYGIKIEVRGKEYMPQSGALIASKHQSMFETMAFWGILPDPAIILKKTLVYLPIFGWYAIKLGNISLDRTGAAKALRKMLRDAATRASEGRQVLIFPEGTRVAPGDNPDYKPGVIGLYQSMKVPCTPVALNSGVHLGNYCQFRRSGTIVIEFLPPIEPGLDKATFMETLHARITTASDALLEPSAPSAQTTGSSA